MGACCSSSSSSSSSRKTHLVGPPIYYYCPASFEDLRPSRVRAVVGSEALTTGLLLDIPDTFRAPAPLPYDLLFGKCTDSVSPKGKISTSSFQTAASCEEDLGRLLDSKTQHNSVILSPPSESPDLSKQKTCSQLVEEEEEDSCPICFEDYDVENPKLKTSCDHEFHLSCILEWMERSHSCPICDKEVAFDDCLN